MFDDVQKLSIRSKRKDLLRIITDQKAVAWQISPAIYQKEFVVAGSSNNQPSLTCWIYIALN